MPITSITLSALATLNLIGLVEARLEEIDVLAARYPHLPMKDSMTVESYNEALRELKASLLQSSPV